VTVPPATTDDVLAATRYCVAAPATMVTGGLEPVRLSVSVLVNVNVAPATSPVTNSTVATPLASVVDVVDVKVSPAVLRPLCSGANAPAPPALLQRTVIPR